jgi:ferredoxin
MVGVYMVAIAAMAPTRGKTGERAMQNLTTLKPHFILIRRGALFAMLWSLLIGSAVPEAFAQGKLAQLKPTFEETGHVPPDAVVPPPRSTYAEYVDLAALLIALSAASYLSLKARSRRGVLLLSVFSLVYFGFWRKGCVCPVGSTQNIIKAFIDSGYAVPLTAVLFFALPLVFALFFGRTFCAGVCPLGAIQDVVLVKPARVPVWVSNMLGLLPHLYLGLAVTLVASGAGYLICRYDPFVGFFRLNASFNMLVFGGGMLVLSMFVGRPYCRFLCPYGVLLTWCSMFSRRHVTITPAECVQCRLCEDSCPFGAILMPTPERSAEPRARGRKRLALVLCITPVLILAGAYLGSKMSVPISRLSDRVLLAERMRLEETGAIDELSVETEGYRRTKEPVQKLYAEAIGIRRRIAGAGWVLGGFVALVICARMIKLSVLRRRKDYVPDRGQCLSCARCFSYCPVQAGTAKEIQE